MTTFLPSAYSTSSDLNGGVLDYFSADAREARQETRKDSRKAKKARKESGKKLLTQKSSPKKLWASKYPWPERPTTAGQAIAYTFVGAGAYEKLSQPISKGSRPPPMFQDREWRATILGGLQALSAVGVPGYTDLGVSSMSVPVLPSTRNDKILLAMAGKKKTLKDGAEFIRKVVIKHHLEEIAWYYRALIMIQPAVVSAAARAAGATLVVTVGGAYMGPWAAIPAAIAAQETTHSAVLQVDMDRFTKKAAQALERAGVDQAVQVAQDQANTSKALADEETVLAQAAAEEQARTTALKYRVAGIVTITAAVGGIALLIYSRNRA